MFELDLGLMLQAHYEAEKRRRNIVAAAKTREILAKLDSEGQFCSSGCVSHEICRNS